MSFFKSYLSNLLFLTFLDTFVVWFLVLHPDAAVSSHPEWRLCDPWAALPCELMWLLSLISSCFFNQTILSNYFCKIPRWKNATMMCHAAAQFQVCWMLNREMNVITFAQILTATRLAPAVILGKILNFLAFDPSGKLSPKLLGEFLLFRCIKDVCSFTHNRH